MKIHSSKVKNDFSSYFSQYKTTVNHNLSLHESNFGLKIGKEEEIFEKLYPLFVIIESLTDPDYLADPTCEIVLEQSIEEGKKDKLILARRALYRTQISDQLRERLQKQIFSAYFSEMYSDAMLLLNQYYLDNYDGCYLHLRCILENLYRHIYYSDHKQELWAVNSGKSEYFLGITPQHLRLYLERVSFLSELKNYNTDFEEINANSPNKKTIFHLNNDLYDKTSAVIHSSNMINLNQFKTNADLAFNQKQSQEVCSIAGNVANMAVIFLICMHFKHFSRFNLFQRQLCIINFDKQTKARLRKIVGI